MQLHLRIGPREPHEWGAPPSHPCCVLSGLTVRAVDLTLFCDVIPAPGVHLHLNPCEEPHFIVKGAY